MMMPTSGPSSTIWHCPALTQLLQAGSFRVRILLGNHGLAEMMLAR